MRCLHLTDDELWRAIADNTNALSALIEKQCEWNAKSEVPAILRTLKSISICRADSIIVSTRTILLRSAAAIQ